MTIDTWGASADSLVVTTVTIANGGSVSGAAPAASLHLVGIQMPAAWTAAALTFQGSADGVTFNDAYDNNGAEINVQAAASRYIAIPPTLLARVPALYVRSGTTGTPVAQGGARVLTLIFARYQ